MFLTNDILLFTETWSNESYHYNVSGFTHHILHRRLINKRAVRESGGLVIYIADKLNPQVSLLKMHRGCIIWLKIDKKLLNSEKHILLCLSYIIPAGSSREAMSEENVYDYLFEDIFVI